MMEPVKVPLCTEKSVYYKTALFTLRKFRQLWSVMTTYLNHFCDTCNKSKIDHKISWLFAYTQICQFLKKAVSLFFPMLFHLKKKKKSNNNNKN